jgi:Biotin-protein ligase, N terminal
MQMPKLHHYFTTALLLGTFATLSAQTPEPKPKSTSTSKSSPPFVVPPDVNGMKTIITPPVESRPLKVMVYSGPGAPEGGVENVVNVLKPFPYVTVTVAPPESFATLTRDTCDVVVFPGGTGGGQSKGLGEAGLKNVRQFVGDGGGYVGICAGAYLACSNFSWGLGILNAGTVSNKWMRGQAILDLETTSDATPILGEVKGVFKVRYNNGPILKPWTRTDLPAYTTLSVFRTETAKYGSPVGVQINSPAQVSAPFGKGRVFVSSPHPENTPGLEYLIPRAVFWAAGESKEAAVP